MNKLLTFICCAAAIFFVGCASARQFVPMPDLTKKVEDPAKGRIYVIRPSSFGGAVGMNISDGGNPIGATGPGTYLCWEREPGDAIVSATAENTSRVAIPVRPGSVHYILQYIRWGIWVARTELEVIAEEQALKLLKDAKPAEVKKE